MAHIGALWIPILLSAVIVFVASSILHMVLPYHKSDYRKLPEEDKVVDALRAAGVTPGPAYHFPHTTHKEMKSPEVVEKFKRGPDGLLTAIPSGPRRFGIAVHGAFPAPRPARHACAQHHSLELEHDILA